LTEHRTHIKGQNAAAAAIGISKSYMSELRKRPGFPEPKDGLFDIVAIDAFIRRTTDPARRRRPVSRQQETRRQRWPKGFEYLGEIENPVYRAATWAMLTAVYTSGHAAAWAAVEAGADMRTAYRISRIMGPHLADFLVDELAESGIAPFSEGDPHDVPCFEFGADETPNWTELAVEAREPVDLEAWQAHEKALIAKAKAKR